MGPFKPLPDFRKNKVTFRAVHSLHAPRRQPQPLPSADRKLEGFCSDMVNLLNSTPLGLRRF